MVSMGFLFYLCLLATGPLGGEMRRLDHLKVRQTSQNAKARQETKAAEVQSAVAEEGDQMPVESARGPPQEKEKQAAAPVEERKPSAAEALIENQAVEEWVGGGLAVQPPIVVSPLISGMILSPGHSVQNVGRTNGRGHANLAAVRMMEDAENYVPPIGALSKQVGREENEGAPAESEGGDWDFERQLQSTHFSGPIIYPLMALIALNQGTIYVCLRAAQFLVYNPIVTLCKARKKFKQGEDLKLVALEAGTEMVAMTGNTIEFIIGDLTSMVEELKEERESFVRKQSAIKATD